MEEIDRGGFDLLFGNSCSYFATPFLARFTDMPSVLYLQEPYRSFYEAEFTPSKDRLGWVAPDHQPARKSSPMAWKAEVGRLSRT